MKAFSRSKDFLRHPTWWCLSAPWICFFVYLSLAIHVRLTLGRWPRPTFENYKPLLFAFHEIEVSFFLSFTIQHLSRIGILTRDRNRLRFKYQK
jgi:hypothetical protein